MHCSGQALIIMLRCICPPIIQRLDLPCLSAIPPLHLLQALLKINDNAFDEQKWCLYRQYCIVHDPLFDTLKGCTQTSQSAKHGCMFSVCKADQQLANSRVRISSTITHTFTPASCSSQCKTTYQQSEKFSSLWCRRQIYNEMKQAAERNRRAVRGDYDTPQPAAPGPARPSEEGHMSPAAPSPALSREPSPSPWQPSGGLGVDPTAEERYSVAAAHCHAVRSSSASSTWHLARADNSVNSGSNARQECFQTVQSKRE